MGFEVHSQGGGGGIRRWEGHLYGGRSRVRGDPGLGG